MFSQGNCSLSVESHVWEPREKMSLKTYMEKVVSRVASKAYIVDFCKVLWDLNTATYLAFYRLNFFA